MSVPNYANVPRQLYDTGLYNLKTEDGQGAFTDACVSTLHGLDPNWGHLIKKPGQTAVHDHGEDSALYKLPDGKAQAVDFIGGAGGPNPQPGWIVDPEARYTHADWFDPQDHGIYEGAASSPRIPSYGELGDDAYFRAMIGVPLHADMTLVGQQLNVGSSVWFSRATYRLMSKLMSGQPFDPAAEVRIVRNEWRAILGLPPI